MPNKSFTVCLTGGGTAGHVTPHFALLPGIKQRGWRVFYIGSAGMDRQLVAAQGIEFHSVATGKLRRYMSWRNVIDLFKVLGGCVQALGLLLRQRPDVLFSKGGFVAVPVAWAAWLLRIPVVSHESDVTPGLANRLIKPVATRLLYTFPETGQLLRGKAELVGTPVRSELLRGSREAGAHLCGFPLVPAMPTLLVMGGSQGAQKINEALLAVLPWLVTQARVIHLTGVGKRIGFQHEHYKNFDFVSHELKDLYAVADAVLSRAGANSIFEILAVRKPMLLIPLEQGSRGDQVINAESFKKQGWATVLREGELTPESLKTNLTQILTDGAQMREAQARYSSDGAAERILTALSAAARAS